MKRTATILASLALSAFALGAAPSALAATSASDAPAKLTQQQKMGICSHQAKEKGLHGEDRREFLSTCLSRNSNVAAETANKPAPATTTANATDKKKSCRADARRQHLTGDARKTFVEACMQSASVASTH